MSGWSESEFREYIRAQIMCEPTEEKNVGFVQEIARRMGISQWTLYDILKGRTDLTPDRLPALCNAIRATHSTSDIPRRILAWLISRCEGFSLSELTEHRQPDGNINDDIEDLMVSAFRLFEERVRAMRDGTCDENERDGLYLHGLTVRRALDGLLAELNPDAKREEIKG